MASQTKCLEGNGIELLEFSSGGDEVPVGYRSLLGRAISVVPRLPDSDEQPYVPPLI